MPDEKKPFMARFEVPLPESVSEEDFKSAITGTGPKSTSTGGFGGGPTDTAADGDIDW